MSRLVLEGLSKRFAGKPPTTAMDDLHLEVEDGEFLVLLGPSGCGKTTTLRCIAGLEVPDSGRISFGETPVFDAESRLNLAPNERSIGMVFQSYALWPHMTVQKNIAYPLKARKIRTEESKSWVERTAEMVDCQHLLDRYPSQLSGGQQQRVALARGLVSRPSVLLLDEPLSNLDARLRDHVRAQLHELHSSLGFTAVFVTHDQAEALALADRIAIMRSGRFEQVGTAEEVFDRPATEYVAEFIGMSNRFELSQGTEGSWHCHGKPFDGSQPPVDGEHVKCILRIRAEDVDLAPHADLLPADVLKLPGRFIDWQFGGRDSDVIVDTVAGRVHARVPTAVHDGWLRRLRRSDALHVGLAQSGCAYFTPAGDRIPVDLSAPAVARS